MAWKVLVSAPYMQPVIEDYRSVFMKNDIELVVPPVRERLSEAELLEWIGDVDGVISGDDEFTERVLQAAPKLVVISKWGTGIDSIDRVAAQRLGIAVRNTPNAFTDSVADTAMGYILCFARQLPWMDRDIRAGRWEKRACPALGERTLGVIGVGNVGKALIRRAVAFKMRVLANDIMEIPHSFVVETGLHMISKDQLLAEADFVSLNCDLNPTSYHIVGERELRLIKPTAYLINIARGPLLEESALVRALKEGRIAGAALDVFETEPLSEDSELLAMDNCLLAPHNANSSPEAWQRVHESTVRNLVEELKLKEARA